MAWTFGGVAFTWLRQDANGHMAQATWEESDRLVVRPLLGLAIPDVADVGDEAPAIAGPIYVAAADKAALRALRGTRGTLSNGSDSWVAVLRLRGLKDLVADGGASGEAEFIRVSL